MTRYPGQDFTGNDTNIAQADEDFLKDPGIPPQQPPQEHRPVVYSEMGP